MATKEERAAEAKKHAGLIKGVFGSDIQKSVETAHIYEDGEGRELPLPEPRFEATKAQVLWAPLNEAMAQGSGKICIVDPANYRTPAGNYLDGGWSPECQICAESSLLAVLEGLKDSYYARNSQSMHGGLYSDRAAYLKDITFTIEGVVKKRDILVIAPPNRRLALENHRSEAECDQDLGNRIQALLTIAAVEGVDTLVVGAFGCGAMDNDPSVVAGLFKQWLDANPGQFETVTFSIAGGPALDVFREVFPEAQKAPLVVEEIDGQDESEDADDYAVDVEPTSDGRWVFD